MANYTPNKPGHTEAAVTMRTPAGVSPATDTFTNDGCTMLNFKNSSAENTVIVESTATCSHGFSHDVTVTVPATPGDVWIGPFSTDRFGTTVTLTWGASVTGLTFGLLSTGGTVTGL